MGRQCCEGAAASHRSEPFARRRVGRETGPPLPPFPACVRVVDEAPIVEPERAETRSSVEASCLCRSSRQARGVAQRYREAVTLLGALSSMLALGSGPAGVP